MEWSRNSQSVNPGCRGPPDAAFLPPSSVSAKGGVERGGGPHFTHFTKRSVIDSSFSSFEVCFALFYYISCSSLTHLTQLRCLLQPLSFHHPFPVLPIYWRVANSIWQRSGPDDEGGVHSRAGRQHRLQLGQIQGVVGQAHGSFI